MKSKLLIVSLILSVLIIISCKKDIIPGAVSVKLSATTYYKNGFEETRRDRSGKIEKNSFAAVINNGTGNKYLVDLGSVGGANASAFGVSFLFETKNNPEAISGTYTFPQDNAFIKLTLRNEVTTTVTEILSFATRGKVTFLYDSNARTISGSIQDLEFSIVPNDPYNRYRVTLKGSFESIPIR